MYLCYIGQVILSTIEKLTQLQFSLFKIIFAQTILFNILLKWFLHRLLCLTFQWSNLGTWFRIILEPQKAYR